MRTIHSLSWRAQLPPHLWNGAWPRLNSWAGHALWRVYVWAWPNSQVKNSNAANASKLLKAKFCRNKVMTATIDIWFWLQHLLLKTGRKKPRCTIHHELSVAWDPRGTTIRSYDHIHSASGYCAAYAVCSGNSNNYHRWLGKPTVSCYYTSRQVTYNSNSCSWHFPVLHRARTLSVHGLASATPRGVHRDHGSSWLRLIFGEPKSYIWKNCAKNLNLSVKEVKILGIGELSWSLRAHIWASQRCKLQSSFKCKVQAECKVHA